MIDPFLSFISLPTTTEILDWVTGDPDALRNAANGWTAAAGEVKATSTELENGLKDVVDNWSGEAYRAFDEYMGKVLVELGKEEAAMTAIAAKLNSIANSLALARDKVVRILVRLAAAVIPLAAIAIFPPAGAVSLAAGAAITATSFASIIVITQALSGVMQGIPDLLNDLHGLEFSPNTLGNVPDALPKKVPLGQWGPQPDEPTGGAKAPVSTGGSSAGSPAGSGAPSTAAGSAPMAPSAPAPVAQAPVTPAGGGGGGGGHAVLTPGTGGAVGGVPTTPPPVVIPPVVGAGMESGLPRGTGGLHRTRHFLLAGTKTPRPARSCLRQPHPPAARRPGSYPGTAGSLPARNFLRAGAWIQRPTSWLGRSTRAPTCTPCILGTRGTRGTRGMAIPGTRCPSIPPAPRPAAGRQRSVPAAQRSPATMTRSERRRPGSPSAPGMMGRDNEHLLATDRRTHPAGHCRRELLVPPA